MTQPRWWAATDENPHQLSEDEYRNTVVERVLRVCSAEDLEEVGIDAEGS